MGFFDSVVGSIFGLADSAANRQQNKDLFNQQLAFNREEAEKGRTHQTDTMREQMAWQDEQRRSQNAWQEQVQRQFYEMYDSPAARVRQFKEAGLNPYLAVDSAGLGNISASSGNSGAAPTGTAGAVASGGTPPYNQIMPFASQFQNVASALKAISEAKKAGTETKSLELMMGEQLTGLQLENEARKLSNLFTSTELKYLDKKEQATLEHLILDVANASITGDKLHAELKKLGLENEQISIFVKNYQRILDAQVANTEADTNLKGEQSQTEPVKREELKASAKNQLSQATANSFKAEWSKAGAEIIRGLKNALGWSDGQAEEFGKKINNSFTAGFISDSLSSVLNSLDKGAEAVVNQIKVMYRMAGSFPDFISDMFD